MVEGGSALGLRQAPDHRRGDRPTQGLLLSGAASCEDVGRAADATSGQDRGLHLRPTDQQLPRPTAAPSGGPVSLARCTSLVLGLAAGLFPLRLLLGLPVLSSVLTPT